MSDKDKLIGLIDNFTENITARDLHSSKFASEFADHLLANGVIAPPCKVGDVVYAVGDKDGHQIKECKVNHFSFESAEHFEVDVYFDCVLDCDGCYFKAFSQSYCGEWDCDNAYGHSCIPIADFGKTVFLTKEEAEAKLKELGNSES